MPGWDVIVAGLGAMGSAVVYELARRGTRVLGLDRFDPPHALGSSHGESRIIREAYFEHPQYVPLVQRAYERWVDLEQASGTTLMRRTGGVMIGPPGGVLVRGALASAAAHDLPHETLDAADLRRRYPAIVPGADMVGIVEPRAGVLFPERCIDAHLRRAAHHGATLWTGHPLRSWRTTAVGVEVSTHAGVASGGALVLASGAWIGTLVPELSLPLTIERTVLHWFDPRTAREQFTPERLPVFLLEHAPGRIIYGMPELRDVGAGVKVARHHEGESTGADGLRREVAQTEIDAMQPLLRAYTPALAGAWLRSAVCMYTNTPDEHFIIDRHPGHAAVWLLSACSGHGFKFSSAIGEVMADLLTTNTCRFDLEPFRADRWR